ncbi:MAG: putative glycoprotein [Pedras lispivirus]
MSIIIYILIVSQCVRDSKAFNYLLHHSSESSYQSGNLGVHIEPAGLTYAYDEFVYANLVYHVPTVQVDVTQIIEGCTEIYKKKLKSEINDINTNSVTYLQRTVPEYTSVIAKPADGNTTVRARRALPLIPLIAGIAALAMAGMIVANTVEVVRLQDRATDLETLLNTVRGNQLAFANKSSELINRVNNIGSVVIPDIESSLKSISTTTRCGLDGVTLNRKVSEQYREYTRRTMNIINALYDHRIIPELLDLSQLKRDILARPEFINSVYSADPMLFYQLTKGYLTSVRHNPFVVASIMIIPVLSRELVGTTATVNRVPVFYNNTIVSLQAPDTVLIDEQRRHVWEVDHSLCMSVAISHFCPIQVLHRRSNKCIEGILFKNESLNCHMISNPDVPFIKHTLTGLLIGLHNQTIQKIVTDKDNKMKTVAVLYNNTQKSIFLPKGFSREILIDGVVFTLTTPRLDVTPDSHIIQVNVSQETVSIPNTTLYPISPLSPLSSIDIPWHPVLSSTHILIFAAVCLLNIYVIYNLRNRIHTLEVLQQHSMRLK